jgi:GNAT superfamily N-acetyltransferase
MKLTRAYRRSAAVDDLVRANFGPCESLWHPKCFDRLYKLVNGSKLLAVCTLQWSGEYWILGDLCVDPQEHGKGYGSELVRQICSKIKDPIWADATHPMSAKILERNSFSKTTIGPWEPKGQAYYKK